MSHYEEWLKTKTTDFKYKGKFIKLAVGLVGIDEDESDNYVFGAFLLDQKTFSTAEDGRRFAKLIALGIKSESLQFREFKEGSSRLFVRNESRVYWKPKKYRIPALDYSVGGSSTKQVFNALFNEYILPYYDKVIKPSDKYSEELKVAILAWLKNPENKSVMIDHIKNYKEYGSYTVNYQLVSESLKIDVRNFWEALFNATEYPIVEALGFHKEIEKVVPNLTGKVGDKNALTLETLDTLAGQGLAVAAALIVTNINAGKELTEAQKMNNRQCALVTALLHDKVLDFNAVSVADPDGRQDTLVFKVSNYFQQKEMNSPLYVNPVEPQGGGDLHSSNRVYPITIEQDKFDPNMLANFLTVSSLSREKLLNIDSSGKKLSDDGKVTKETLANENKMTKGLFWVYKGTDGQIREIKIPLSSNGTLASLKAELRKLHRAKRILNGSKGTSTERFNKAKNLAGSIVPLAAKESFESGLDRAIVSKRTEAMKAANTQKDGFYYLEKIGISYQGTNPSTARSDVKVEISFNLSSLSELSKVIIQSKDSMVDKQLTLEESVEFRLMDLITLPNTRKTETKGKTGGFITNENSPEYSRVRLKVKAGDDKESNLILDLTTIDHSLSRQSESGEVTLTINYRGYFESVLNMPYNDALASDAILNERKAVNDEMEKLVKDSNNCDPKMVREAMRMQQEFVSRQSRQATASSIIKRLLEANCIHTYSIDSTKTDLVESYVDPKFCYVSKITPTNMTPGDLTNVVSLEEEVRKKDKDEDDIKTARNKIGNKFFFLGDLMYYVSDCLFEKNASTHRAELYGLNLRFIVGTVYVPNPNDLNGAPLLINPCSIPIDLSFFVEWFNSTAANKGLTFYPVGTFIRDLIERVVNGVIYDTCFSMLLPDENPPLLRSRVFNTTRNKFFKKSTLRISNGWFYPKSPYGIAGTEQEEILMSKNAFPDEGDNDSGLANYSYCVIYQQSPSFFRQIRNGGNKPLKDQKYVPTIFYGQGNETFNFVSNVSFSKTNSPGLREARFFNTNYGGLSLLSNVYDLSFSFYGRAANTIFYPGNILNFILLDFEGKKYDIHPSKSITIDEDTGYSDYSSFGQSNPHKKGTLANMMGLGGYFIVKSVDYELGQTDEEFEIKISTKFLGNDGENSLVRESEEEKNVEAADTCQESFNTIRTKVNGLQSDGDAYFDDTVSSKPSTSDSGPVAEKVSETGSETGPPAAPTLSNWLETNFKGKYTEVTSSDYNTESMENSPKAVDIATAIGEELKAGDPPVGEIWFKLEANQNQFYKFKVSQVGNQKEFKIYAYKNKGRKK